MKLILINPFFQGVYWAPTMGLGFIASYIKKNTDWNVEVIEPALEDLNKEYVLDKCKNANIVGLSCYTGSRFECFSFAEEIRHINPECKIFVGGPHANTLDTHILEHYPFVDGVVRSEGEETMLEIVMDKNYKDIYGLTWRNGNEIRRNLDRPMAEDISRYSYDYSYSWNFIKGWKDFEVPANLLKRNHLPIIFSRGCPFLCKFCSANEQWGKVWRGIEPEEMANIMEDLVKKYNIGYFRFYDAVFIGKKQKILEFCDALEKKKLDISFRIDIRVGTPRNVLERLKAVGCDVVGFGIESGSDRILKRHNKGINRAMILQTIKDCKELGFWTIGFFMVSMPGETIEDVRMTFDLFEHLDTYNYQFFKIHPNTTIYDELKESGEVNDEIWFNKAVPTEVFYCKENFPSAYFGRTEIDIFMHRMYADFNVHNPKTTFTRYGIVKGSAIYTISLFAYYILNNSMGKRVFSIIKNSSMYDKIFSAFLSIYKSKI